jgi:hypothetical protein
VDNLWGLRTDIGDCGRCQDPAARRETGDGAVIR